MRRYTTTTLALIGSVMLLAACGGEVPQPSSAGATVAVGGSGAAEPMLAWTFAAEAITEAGEVDLKFSGAYEFAGNAVNLDGRTAFGASVDSAPPASRSRPGSAWRTRSSTRRR